MRKKEKLKNTINLHAVVLAATFLWCHEGTPIAREAAVL